MRKNTKRNIRKRKNRGNKRITVIFIGIILLVLGIFIKVTTVNANDSMPERYKYYTSIYVERDDTLWGIAERYAGEEYPDIRDYIDEVKAINHLGDDTLPYGITISVPYYSEEFK